MEKILISTLELQKMIGCGRANAVKFGDEAGARVRIGKLLRWNVAKIQKYLEENADECAIWHKKEKNENM